MPDNAARTNCTRLVLLLTGLFLVAAAAVPTAAVVAEDGAVDGRSAALVAVQGDDVRPATAPPVLPGAPEVVSRADWDPAGECQPSTGKRTRPDRIALHHTHIPVVEAPEEVPGALRSICTSHVERGFSEIGYHYAIDPFGRIWQGRGPLPGEMTPTVRNGAHTQGFNDNSLGVVFIGDFDVAEPSAEAVEAAEELLAYLTAQYELDPSSSVQATSTGGTATRFEEGTNVDLPTIAGHRDTGSDTACPGEHLYALLPHFRTAVAERLAAL